jgi:hypothetical protein
MAHGNLVPRVLLATFFTWWMYIARFYHNDQAWPTRLTKLFFLRPRIHIIFMFLLGPTEGCAQHLHDVRGLTSYANSPRNIFAWYIWRTEAIIMCSTLIISVVHYKNQNCDFCSTVIKSYYSSNHKPRCKSPDFHEQAHWQWYALISVQHKSAKRSWFVLNTTCIKFLLTWQLLTAGVSRDQSQTAIHFYLAPDLAKKHLYGRGHGVEIQTNPRHYYLMTYLCLCL